MTAILRGHASVLSVLAAVVAVTGCTSATDDAHPPRSSPTSSSAPQGASSPAGDVAPGHDANPLRRAAKLTGALIAAEQAIKDPQTSRGELRRAAHTQQLLYRELGGHPEWHRRLLDDMPADLREVVHGNLAARREFRSMHPRASLSDTLPAWRIVRPAPMAELLRFYRQAEATYDVGWEYLAAINLVETAMGRIRGTSTAGAQGPMQFIPSTWAAYGEGDINDPADAIMAAARYLAANGFARTGGVPGALYRYNNSTAYVRGVTHHARVMERHPRSFHGYYHWQVYYATTEGDVLLPVGYERTRPVPVKRYLAAHPQT